MLQPLDLEAKLALLMSLAGDDKEGLPTKQLPPRLRHAGDVGALRPLNMRSVRIGGTNERVTLMRILMTNACIYNCHYCPMRRDRDMPRTLLKPAELVRIFLDAVARGWCTGLFLTTAIAGRPVKVMDDLIEVLSLLRETHRFTGYIHVKMVPGAEVAQIERLTQLATRVSMNLEAPCGDTLARIAPEKDLATALVQLERVRSQVNERRNEEYEGRPRDLLHPGGTAGMTMQFVVGATPDSDRTIIDKVSELYAGRGIHHTQFSAFRPIRDTPLEDVRATPVLREARLYQTDHLLREYGFTASEMVYDSRGNLPLANDPKTAWALAHPEYFPVEIRTASRSQLLRVPGIGPGGARRIVSERLTTTFRSLRDLRALGVTARAGGFVTLGGRKLQTTRWTEQLGFWQPEDEVGTHHVQYSVSPGTFR